MLVKFKPTGQLGNIPDNEFDPSIYEPAGGSSSTPQAPPMQAQMQAPHFTQQSTPSPQPPQPSLITKVGNAAIGGAKALFNAPYRLGKGLSNAVNAGQVSENQDVITKNAIANSDVLRNAAIKASQSGNKEKAQKLFNMANKALQQINSAASSVEKAASEGKKDVVKGGVGTAAFFVPGGKTSSARITSAGISGEMSGLGQSETGNELADTVGGGIAGLAIGSTLEGLGGIKEALGRKLKGGASKLEQGANAIEQGTRQIKQKASVYGAGKEKAINNTLNEYGFKGSAQKQYANLEPTMNTIEGKVQQVIQNNPGITVSKDEIKNSFMDNLKSSLRSKDLTQKQATTEVEGYLNDLVKASGGDETIGSLNLEQLRGLKKLVNSDYGPIYDIAERGGALTPRQKVIMAAWDSLDNAVKQASPELKKLLTDESNLYKAAPSLSSARSNPPTLRVWGTSVPQSVTQKGRDIAAGSMRVVADVAEGLGNTPSTLPSMARNAGVAVPLSLGKSLNEKPQDLQSNVEQNMGNNQPYPEINSSNHMNSIPDAGLGENPPTLNPYGATPELIYREYQNAQNAGDMKTANRLRAMFEDELAYQKNNKTVQPKKTEKQQMFSNASVAAQQALDLLNTNKVNTGIGQRQLGKLGEMLGTNSDTQQQYRSSLAIARTTVRSALLGSQMSPGEMESIAAFIPEFDDAPSTAKSKLNTFIKLMATFGKNLQGTAPDYQNYQSDQGLGATPPAL